MSIEYRRPNCGFSYEVHAIGKTGEPCPNCGSQQTAQDDNHRRQE